MSGQLEKIIRNNFASIKSFSDETGIKYSRLIRAMRGNLKHGFSAEEILTMANALDISTIHWERYFGPIPIDLKKEFNDSITKIINRCLDHHGKWKHSYFWTPSYNASGRRKCENKNNFEHRFVWNDREYRFVSDLSVSCANYYYNGRFYQDGLRKDAGLFKRLLKAIEASQD